MSVQFKSNPFAQITFELCIEFVACMWLVKACKDETKKKSTANKELSWMKKKELGLTWSHLCHSYEESSMVVCFKAISGIHLLFKRIFLLLLVLLFQFHVSNIQSRIAIFFPIVSATSIQLISGRN